MDLEKLMALKAEKVAAMDAIWTLAKNENRDLTEDEQGKFDALDSDCDKLNGKIEKTQKLAALKSEVEDSKKGSGRKVADGIVSEVIYTPETKVTIPDHVKQRGSDSLKAFKGPDANEKAYKAGMWYMACQGSKPAREFCKKFGIPVQFYAGTGHQETVNTTGGYLVPDQLDSSIIDLSYQYGAFRRNARVVNMTSDVCVTPRRTSGLTAYFVGESGAGTESTKGWDQVQLVAKKMIVLSKISSELREDAIISIADDLTNEIARAFALKEDQCGFIGDGTSTYGGIMGVRNQLAAKGGVVTTTVAGGVVPAAGNLFSEFTITEFNKAIAALPTYAHAGAKWFCSPFFYAMVMQRLAIALAGNNVANYEMGMNRRSFLGYPVELVEVMPVADVDATIMCLFGDMSLAADFGDRRQTTIAFSDTAYVGSQSVFEQDEIAVRGTKRFDINVHDVGSTTVAGPIVGIQSIT